MNLDSGKRKIIIGAALTVLFIAGVWWLSYKVGADFRITLDALWHSIPVVVIVSGLTWYFKPKPLAGYALMAAALWPVWWRVLDSIAASPEGLDFAYATTQPWWTSSIFKWTVEIILIALAGWLFFPQGKKKR